MHLPEIAFIGAGNMGRALIGGLTRAGADPSRLRVADPAAEQLRIAREEFGVSTVNDNATAVRDADVVIVAVKPQVMRDTISELAAALALRGPLLISVAAGIRLAAIAGWLGGHQRIVRTMPNRPALLGCGVTALYAPPPVSSDDRQLANAILGSVGTTVWLEREEQIDVVTAVSGSGPAYFFYLMEAMIDAGIALGLDADTARALTLKTAYGAAIMANESTIAPAELRRNVTSPGGTTERAISVLDGGHGKALIERAVREAAQRSVELAKEFAAQ